MIQKLFLTNTLTRSKEEFVSLKADHVRMYVCGVTPYNDAHVGHGRCYVTFDVLARLLRFLGYDVCYTRNVTDIDDKLLNRALSEGDIELYSQIAQNYEISFTDDMLSLGCTQPTYEPRVTENIQAIIDMIQGLVQTGYAYVVGPDVYYDISRFASYGALSGRKPDELMAGARVAVNDLKRNPGDFILWKGNEDGLFWVSPWGFGRPGWHIECSALAYQFLGETIDIHGGGLDLIFPHHENEIAQSEAYTDQPFARYWVHNALVTINTEKMSKSLGNFCTLKDVFAVYDPMVLRFYYLQHHYRTPLDFSFQGLQAAQKAYGRLVSVLAASEHENFAQYDEIPLEHELLKPIMDALCDDLNTSKVLAILFENLHELQKNSQESRLLKGFLVTVLGLTFKPFMVQEEVVITPHIQALIDERAQARAQKNWARADAIRSELEALGVLLEDKKIS